MHTINPNDISTDRIFKLLSGSITPRPVTLISTKNENGTTNVAPFSFVNVVSDEPPLISVSIQTKNGELKDTAKNLVRTGEAVVHMVNFEMLEGSYATSHDKPYGVSEIEETNFMLSDSRAVDVKAVEQAFIRFEVELFVRIHVNEGCDLFLLKIINMHFAEGLIDNGNIDFSKTKSVGALLENQFIDYDNHIIIKDDAIDSNI